METITFNYFSKKVIPFILLSLVAGALGGSFFGRINTITCDKKANTCRIESKGYLYKVYTEEFAMNEIISTHVQKVTDEAPVHTFYRQTRPDLNYYSLIIERGMIKPLKVIPNTEVPVHDVFNYAIPIFEVSDAFNAYLANSDQNKATFTFGTYRTGFVFSITIFLGLAFWFYNRHRWTLSYSSRKDRVTKDFLDNSGNQEFITRTAYSINIKRGKSDIFNAIIYLTEGSSILFEDGHMKVKHSFRKKPEKINVEIPKNLPSLFKEKLSALKA